MKVNRQDILQICDKFLRDEISKQDIEEYAWAHITNDNDEYEDDVVAETLFDWDNEEINYPITKVNMKLWEKRLLTDIDELPEHNIWNLHVEKQKEICNKYSSAWNPVNNKLFIGVSENLTADPINGLRHLRDTKTTGWFIWTGEYSEADDFFKPISAEHLLQIRPQIIKYLGLDIGFRFLTDNNGYEDVWYDETLKNYK